MKRIVISTLAVAVSFLTLPAAQSSPFTFTSLPFSANDINDAGQIVGYAPTGEGGYAVLYQGGVLTSLPVPAATFSVAAGINDQGEIAGSYTDRSGASYGFVYAQGSLTILPLAHFARAINDTGQLAGYFIPVGTPGFQGFFYNGSSYVTIAVPGARSTEALGIDNAGDVVGTYTDSSGRSHGFLYGSQGVLTTIDVPGSTETFVNGINNLGTIVGSFTSSVSGTHGFIYEGGVFTMVDAPSGITQLLSINDLGEIVLRQGNGASYLATPVPEPSDFALVGIGLCGLLCIRKIGFRRDR